MESLQRKYERGAADLIQMNQSLATLALAPAELIKCWSEWQSARLRLVVIGAEAPKAGALRTSGQGEP